MVFRYLKKFRENGNHVDEDFLCLIKTLNIKYKIPYSEAHMLDLSKGYSETTKKFIEEDINFIVSITNSNAIAMEHDDYEIGKYNPYDLFSSILNDKRSISQVNFQQYTGSDPLDLEGIPKDFPLKEELWENGGVFDSSVVQRYFIKNFDDFLNDKTTYKNFVGFFKSFKELVENNHTLSVIEKEYFYKIFPFFDLFEIDDIAELKVKFQTIFDSYCIFAQKSIESFQSGDLIEIIYMLLDMSPIFAEKFKGKNRLINITRDCKHLYYAHMAQYFVTEDAKTKEKSKFVVDYLNFKVNVLSMEEFLHKFS